jgi:hypothetical protein
VNLAVTIPLVAFLALKAMVAPNGNIAKALGIFQITDSSNGARPRSRVRGNANA